MGKRGPAPKGEYANKSAVLSTRITSDLKNSLASAAKSSGRSLSQEIEYRLRRSFDEDRNIFDLFGGRQLYAIFRIIPRLAELHGARRDDWLHDPYLFDQTLRSVNAVLEQFRPHGEVSRGAGPRAEANSPIQQSWSEAFQVAAETHGVWAAKNLVEQIAKGEPGLPAAPTKRCDPTPYIKNDLGTLTRRLDPEKMHAALALAESESHARLRADIRPEPKGPRASKTKKRITK
jgi:hypothetical protein